MPISSLLRRARGYLVHHVLSLDDTPHRIALGVALGVWLAFTPTVGLQSVLLLGACAILGANKLVGLPFVWISNPATIVPIFYPSYRLGSWILNRAPREVALEVADGGFLDRTRAWYDAVGPVFLELWVGSVLVATPIGLVAYVLVRRAVVAYRRTVRDWKERRIRRYGEARREEP